MVALFSGICFALATITENALMSKAVLESKYDFVRIVDIETEAMENVCRVIQRPVTIKIPRLII